MLRKITAISIILLSLMVSVNALCGDEICEPDESETCCLDCGCSFGKICENNECVKAISFFSFTSEISIFLLVLIVLLAVFVIGYGLNIVVAAHKKTEEHFEKKMKEPAEKKPEPKYLMTDEDIRAKIMSSIKEGKTINQIKKELHHDKVDPALADELLTEIVDSLITKAEQGLLSVDWDPRIVDYVFKEMMKKPRMHRKKRKLKHHKKQKLKTLEEVFPLKAKQKPEPVKEEKPSKEKFVREVEKFIGIGLARGYSNKDIKKRLVDSGWNAEEIDKIFDKFLKRKY